MRLKAFRKIGDPQPIDQDVAVVLVEGMDGKPVMVSCDLGNGVVHSAHAADAEFNRVLKALGFDKLVVTDVIDKSLSSPDKLPKLLDGPFAQ